MMRPMLLAGATRMSLLHGAVVFATTAVVAVAAAPLVEHDLLERSATPEIAGRAADAVRLLGLVAGSLAAATLLLLPRSASRRLPRADLDSAALDVPVPLHPELVADAFDPRVQSRSAVILGLATLAESRDDATGRHLDRIRRYVRLLGEQLVDLHPEMDEEFLETIVETSALHDIGKVGIPDHVLLNPGQLTDAQREIVKKHTLIGGDTLLAVKRRWGDDAFLVTACEIVFAHHERFDGSGYPFGLRGETIPLAARIVSVADVYDALTNERVYKNALGHDEAARIIVEGRGSQFDPLVVDAFRRADAAFRAARSEFDLAVDAPPFGLA